MSSTSNYLSDGSAVAHHRTAFPPMTRSLQVPAGATCGQSTTYNGSRYA